LKKYFLIIIFVLFLGLIVAGSATAATDVNPGNGTFKKAASEEEYEEPFKVSSGQPNQVITVNPGRGTLKKAIEDAKSGDTLKLTTGTYYDYHMALGKDLTIIGPEHTGMPTAVINAERKGTMFVFKAGEYILKNIAITNANGGGGGIYNYGTVDMNGCDVNVNNVQMGNGGGIYNFHIMTMDRCNVIGNTAYYDGGGIYNYRGTLTMKDCNVKYNHANGYGGGINNNGSLIMNNCDVSGNTARYGGGINNNGSLIMNNCNVNNNSANGYGGGINNNGHVYVDQSTLNGIFNNYPNNVSGYPLEIGPSGGDDNGNANWRAVNAVSATKVPMQKTGLSLIGLVFAMLLILGSLYKR
jgi:hypothetical protein